MKILDKFSTTTKVCVLFAFVAAVTCVAGYFYSTMSARAAGEQTCSKGGVTAKWIGGVDDVTCSENASNEYSFNNVNATEITLSGGATGRMYFSSSIDSFTRLNLDNLTEDNRGEEVGCGVGVGCIQLSISNTDKVDVNVIGNNLVSFLDGGGLMDEMNIIGPGILNTRGIINTAVEVVVNLNANVRILSIPEDLGFIWLPYSNGSTLNILGGNLTIDGKKESGVYAALDSDNIHIANEANVTINLYNPDPYNFGNNALSINANNSITFGDRIVGKRDGVVIDDLYNMDNYNIAAKSSAVITFGAPATDPTEPINPNPNNPITDLTPPNTGYFK